MAIFTTMRGPEQQYFSWGHVFQRFFPGVVLRVMVVSSTPEESVVWITWPLVPARRKAVRPGLRQSSSPWCIWWPDYPTSRALVMHAEPLSEDFRRPTSPDGQSLEREGFIMFS